MNQHFITRAAALLVLLVCTALVSAQQTSKEILWVGSWSNSPVTALSQPLQLPPGLKLPESIRLPDVPPPVEKATVRAVVRGTAGGDQVRIRISNFYGTTPLNIGAAHIALCDSGSGIKEGTDRALTFGGQPSIAVPPGALALSDPTPLRILQQALITVSLFFPETTPVRRTIHFNAVEEAWVVPGDATGRARLEDSKPLKYAYFLVGVDVKRVGNLGTIVALGDSITDGGSLRWPALLSERLHNQKKYYGVLNQGLAGNRILSHSDEGLGALFGINALARLERDVLSQPAVKYLILYEGINDIGHTGVMGNVAPPTTPQQIIAGMRQIIVRAHQLGIKVYVATLAPFEGTLLPGYYSAEKEVTRQAVNQWIRTSREFDGYFDFDKALQDPTRPTRLRPEYDTGDHLHPNDAGERAMSEAIDLSVFK